jgi:hypothetical protein
MHLIAYTSEINPVAGEEETIIKDIVDVARKSNAETHITGVLFFHEGRFLQIIEGEETDLKALMEKICNDNRHSNVRYLIDSQEKDRCFGSWKMDDIQLGKGKHFDADYLEQITKIYEKLMQPSCDILVHFYKKLLQERKRVMGIF